MKAYESPDAFRRALEDRLKAQHRETALPLDRLRKEAAAQRLLARLVEAAPQGSWALKGGLAMIAWIGPAARATRDADTTWRQSADALRDTVASLADVELDDYFVYEIGEPEDITAEGPERGLRFRVVTRLAGREFETFRLDVNIVPSDPRPTSTATLRNVFGFAGLPDVVVPRDSARTATRREAPRLHTRLWLPAKRSGSRSLRHAHAGKVHATATCRLSRFGVQADLRATKH